MNPLIIFLITMMPTILLAQDHANLIIGTYTNGGNSKGIYVYDFNLKTGESVLKSETPVANPSFLTLSPDKHFVYAVSEEGAELASANAFTYDRFSGKLGFIDSLRTGGASPCHIITDAGNKHVIVANYSGGSLSVFKTKANGSLDKKVQFIQYEGSGPDKSRQEKPHAHSSTLSPDGKFLFVQDLGTDQIHVYAYDATNPDEPLRPATIPTVPCTPGGGPRHITFSADGRFVYLVQEMGARVQVFAYQKGTLRSIQEISMLAPGFTGKVGAADIHLSPDGKFLYTSNRLEANDLCIYQVNKKSGKLTYVTNQSVLGKNPRNFAITANGKFLLAANQDTNNVVIFNRDAQTGLLTDSGKRISVGAPVCLLVD
ncbi:6-phosphogluconolactonase [bacterium A37T11]|nr:6-phosphogluconolactonase [bacterium A37T11]